MSKTLSDIFAKFGCSEPIFSFNVIDNDLIINLVNRYLPDVSTDPVEMIAIQYYDEVFDHDTKTFKKMDNEDKVYAQIVDRLSLFYVTHCKLKSPKQSKTYRWLISERNRYNEQATNDVVNLYRYVSSNSDNHFMFIGEKSSIHIKNSLAVLEGIRTKYGSR